MAQDQVTTLSPVSSKVSLSEGRGGVLGVKAGMTQVYDEEGKLLAVSVIHLAPSYVSQVKTKSKEGYSAVQIGLQPKKKVSSAEASHAAKSGQPGFYRLKEFRLPIGAKVEQYLVGAEVTAEFLKPGDLVDVCAISKGKGYQGGMKRYHMAGGFKSHGASVCHRSLGSIGNRADPAKTFRNKKMPGQMGNVRTTVQNIKVVQVDSDNKIMLVHGSVPGPRTGIVMIRKAIKSTDPSQRN